ncbi:unnamed protein product, partial [marine sediment metagenome]
HDDWFARMYELDPDTNYYIIAKQDYNRGWISYLTAVWQMLRERIEADATAREKASQQNLTKPELSTNLNDDKGR